MYTADFDFDLPRDRIAQAPVARGTSRLLVLDRAGGAPEHHTIADLPALLDPGDLLLLNDTKVIPARLWAVRPTGRRFELLLSEQVGTSRWKALLRPSARARVGEKLLLEDGGQVIPVKRLGSGQWLLSCDPALGLERLETLGEPPLPPYIARPDGANAGDRQDYQTVYASQPGAVAAPTAGLHLTSDLLAEIRARDIEVAMLTLHVGIGTFRPLAVDRIVDHRMDGERYHISDATAAAVNRARSGGRRLVCVGTTSVRTIEAGLAAGAGTLRSGSGETDLFITPGYRFLGVGALLTNFHLPRSTLLMLVSAFAGRERILATYREAVAGEYRFFSYGDAMLIL